jgi:putative ABC transport system permease protein
MTVVDAMRNLPESERPSASLAEMLRHFLKLLRRLGSTHHIRRIVFEQLPDTFIGLTRTLIGLGILPLLVGYWLLQLGLQRSLITPFSLGLSLLVIGGGLLLKSGVDWILSRVGKSSWKRPVRGIFAAVVGLTIVAYWALPFDALASLGLPRFQGGVEVFFVAGLMMIFGAVWALIANAELLVRPLLAVCSWLPGLLITSRLASAYPLHHRFRTGLSVVMFSMVVFAMTIMAVITNAMQDNYTDINFQTGGYDIQAVAYFKPIHDIRSALASHGIDPSVFTAIGTQASTAVGVIQPSATTPAWHIYPAQVVSGGFLQGYGLHLAARARGFESDNAVWQALQSHPNYALIDITALPYRFYSPTNSPVYDPSAPSPASAGSPIYPPGFDPYYTFSMSGVYQGDMSFTPTPVWVAGFQQHSAMKLTIIGVVDNSDSAHFGLYISNKAYSDFQTDPSTPEAETYYFKVAPGQDKRALALALGSAFLDNGLETTVLEDAIWTVRGPRILLSNVLLGVVGLTLLLGVAALAITGTRAVIERRQQIGMLRALGSKRRMLQGAFLCESIFVGFVGSAIGVILGLILSRNIFAVNFFEQFHTGLTFAVPWQELGLVVGIALLASLLAALLPAWQAGRVAPTEALRS